MVLETKFYDILQITPAATSEEISRSFKKLALKCHPDKTNHDPKLTEIFKQLTRAYEVLRDESLRQVYDKYGEHGLGGTVDMNRNSNPTNGTGTMNRNLGNNRNNANFKFRSATDVFSQVFYDFNNINQQFPDFNSFGFPDMSAFPSMGFPNMNSQFTRRSTSSNSTNNNNMNGTENMTTTVRPAPPSKSRSDRLYRGKDIFHTCSLTLEELANGKIVKLQLPRRTKCDICQGNGGFDKSLCKTCEGSGKVIVTMSNLFSKFQEIGLCKDCSGIGYKMSSLCNNCDGGYLMVNKIIELVVLPGTKSGQQIVIKEGGDEGRNIIPGDIVIKIKQKFHPYLVRKYNDLYTEFDIDLKTALLGGSIILQNFLSQDQDLRVFINVHGDAKLNNDIHSSIHTGEIVGTINPGDPKIVKGFGMPINNKDIDGVYYQTDDLKIESLDNYLRGDLFIKFNIQLPNTSEFNLADLNTLNSILPDRSINITGNVKETHLSNLPSFTDGINNNFKNNSKEGSFSSNSSEEPDSKRYKFS